MNEVIGFSGEKARQRKSPWDVVKSGLEYLGDHRLQKALSKTARKIEPDRIYASPDGLTEVYRVDSKHEDCTSITISRPSPEGRHAKILSITAEAGVCQPFGRIYATMTECSYNPDDMGSTATFDSLGPLSANTLPRAAVVKMLRQANNTPLE